MGVLRGLRLNPRLELRQAIDRLGTSIWAAPALGVVLAIAGAFSLIELDRQLADERSGFVLFDGGPESARELLSTIASSMLTFTALVFSITILVLQLASSQFSPRVVRTFLGELVTKVAMAMFIGTFVYAMAVLSQVRVAPEPFVPGVATWVALVLVVSSVGVFIRYIHRMAHSIRVITIITKISDETRREIDHTFPEDPGRELPDDDARPPAREPDVTIWHTGAPGVITYLDEHQLCSSCEPPEATIQIVPKIGDFVATGGELLRVWGRLRDADHCRAAIALDIERTPRQDPGFGFRQLVDIAVRALSPGVNDPSTAVQALDHLHDLVRRLTQRELPQACCARQLGHLRLIMAALDYAGYVRLAFEEIRTYGESSVQVRERLERALLDCLSIAPPHRRAPLDEQLALLRAGRVNDTRSGTGRPIRA